MPFTINTNLLYAAHAALKGRRNVYWIVGGSGSGKSTICQALAVQFDMHLYDMDAYIYGGYHSRFTPERHPVNTAWTTAENGLAWLLSMSWDEFNNFNQAALPEYVDLLVADLATLDPSKTVLIDGGICNPALLTQVISTKQLVCLARPGLSSKEIWEETPERTAMKEFIYQLPNPEEAWQTFLDFDARITQTILAESQQHNIAVCSRSEAETVAELTERVAILLGEMRDPHSK